VSVALRLAKALGEVLYRRSPPWDTDEPAPELVELVEGPAALSPGRALDLGCGTGTNAVYLAGRGWEVTGVDLVRNAVAAARRRAAGAGVDVRLLEGDVTELGQLGIGGDYTLLTDIGCLHGIPPSRRDAYATEVSRAAAPGAVLLVLGIGRLANLGIDPDELARRFGSWRLRRAVRLPVPDFYDRFRPTLPVRALARSRLPVWRCELER
jgi:SAM-dependent methyltransferase